MRRVLVGVVVASFTMSPLSAQGLREAMAREAASVVAQEPSPGATGIPPKFKWTGIALLGAGAYLLILGAASDRTGTYCILDDCSYSNATLRTSRLIGGAAAAGVGGAMLAIGVSKSRKASPTVVFGPSGIALRKTVPVNLSGMRAIVRPARR